MSNKTNQDEALIRYLIGSLPEAEAERLDELSFTDDKFADALQSAENDLLDAYVQGELTGAVLEQFESHYLASPLRREKLKFARAFQHMAAKQLAAEARTGKKLGTAAKRKGRTRWNVFHTLASLSPGLRVGAAFASLILFVAGGWLVFENFRQGRQASQSLVNRGTPVGSARENQNELAADPPSKVHAESERRAREERESRAQETNRGEEQARQAAAQQLPTPRRQRRARPGPSSIASFVLTPQMRGAPQVRTISVPPQTDYVSARLELEPVDYSFYRATLLNASGNETLWRSRRLKAGAGVGGRALNISFPAGLLQQGTYLLRVTGDSGRGAAEIVSDYSFRVVK